MEAYLATGDTAFGAAFASETTGNWTTQADRFRWGATTGTVDGLFDNIRLDSGSMPPSGSAPNRGKAGLAALAHVPQRWFSRPAHGRRFRPWLTPPAGQIWKSYYYAGGQRVALRVEGDPTPANNGVFFLLGDHLGSTSLTANGTTGAWVAEVRYKAWGENRYASGTTPTTYRYTGQRQESTLGGADGLYYYGARWYDPALGRFLQADTIVPDPGNPQDLNRYAYVRNNPLRYTDPSGYDPLDAEWERAFREATGRDSTDKDRQDRLFSLIYKGSGPDGAWTEDDWQWYTTHRDDLYHGREKWRNDDQEAGLDRFIYHVGKLATYYTDDERDQFVRGFALLYGGILYSAGWKSAAAMTAANLKLTGLAEGMGGWDIRYYDSDYFKQDQTHHYAGLFFLGYFGGRVAGRAINQVRDGRPDYYNAGDVDLGKLAVDQGVKFREMSPSQLATNLLPALRPPWKR